MPGWKEYYSHPFNDDWFGVVTGTSTAQSFPSGTARAVRFKADPSNQGNFIIGFEYGDMVYPLDAGDDTGWLAASQSRLENYRYIGDGNVGYFWVQR